MSVRIFRPAKKATQSGKCNGLFWVLEFEPQSPPRIEPFMGYVSSSDMKKTVRLFFKTCEEAIAYAKKNLLEYSVEPQKEKKTPRISYAENFRYDRKIPWTH